ncbi:hypothetical protein [Kribbella monticola]|uniref:hypothetical protein n=1 Tax=Kribbella monticola TaxID=2185285 RepID=UPI0013007229|nr:hypothetical protein [Kribbella monticola]
MQFTSQFVPWRAAIGATVVSVLALGLAGLAHSDNNVHTTDVGTYTNNAAAPNSTSP